MNLALILAGGSGTRMGGPPKQFQLLGGKELIAYSIEACALSSAIDAICIVCRNEYRQKTMQLASDHAHGKKLLFSDAGENRRASSYNGVLELAKYYEPDDVVLIHDAARPFLSQSIIDENILLAMDYSACTTAYAARDTMYYSEDGKTMNAVYDRSRCFHAQTPQSFRLGLILRAHEHCEKQGAADITDDIMLVSSLFENMGTAAKPVFAKGSPENMKITEPSDLLLAECILSSRAWPFL